MIAKSEPRFRKRVPCRVSISGSSYTGMVLNVSRGGLFVQTSAHARPGEDVDIAMTPRSRGAPIQLGARVVWKRVVAPQLRTVTQGGVGLRIRSAPESWYDFLVTVSGRSPGTAARPAAPARPLAPAPRTAVPRPSPDAGAGRFRVRAKQRGGPRSRTLLVDGSSADDARRAALAELGDSWIVLEVTPA